MQLSTCLKALLQPAPVFLICTFKKLCVFGLAVNEIMYQGLALNGNMKSELRIGDMYEKL